MDRTPWERLGEGLPETARIRALLDAVRRSHLPAELEPAFRASYARETWRRLQIGTVTGLALFGSYGLWDLLAMPADLRPFGLAVRFGLVCPLLLAILWVGARPERRTEVAPLVAATMFTAGWSVVTLLHVGALRGHPGGHEGVFLVTIATYSLTGLRAAVATPVALSFLAFHLLGELWVSGGATRVLPDAVFLAATNLIGFLHCLASERSARRNFASLVLLQEVADRDGLTTMANRRAFDAHVDRVWRQASRDGKPVALALVDIDHFKHFNDRHGHLAGDEALRRVGEVLAATAMRGLDFAGRFGGEEFVLLWYGAPAEALPTLAKRVHEGVGAIEGLPEPLTVSIGLVWIAVESPVEPLEALAVADEALYDAKERGRDRFVVRLAATGEEIGLG